MLKWLFGLLLLANLVLFVALKWGGWLTTELENPSVKAELNAAQVRVLNELPVATILLPPVQQVAPIVAPSLLPKPAPVVKVEPAKSVCYRWGVLEAEDIERAQKILLSTNLPNKMTQHQVMQANGYWVYIGPLKSREEVKLNASLLKSLGIADFYVLTDTGLWRNTISLGVYKTEAAAQSYLARLNAKSVPQVKMAAREHAVNEASFELGPVAPTALGKLESLRKNFPESHLHEISCAAK